MLCYIITKQNDSNLSPISLVVNRMYGWQLLLADKKKDLRHLLRTKKIVRRSELGISWIIMRENVKVCEFDEQS